MPRHTQDTAEDSFISDTRLSRSVTLLPRSFSYKKVFSKLRMRSYNPTNVVWAPPRSLAATWGISVDLFSRVT